MSPTVTRASVRFVAISAGRVQRHLLAEHQIGQRPFGCLPERLAQLGRVDAVESHLELRFVVGQGREGVAVVDTNDADGDRLDVGCGGEVVQTAHSLQPCLSVPRMSL